MTGGVVVLRRALALAILLAILLAAYGFVLSPVAAGLADRAAERETLQDELARDRRLAHSSEDWARQARRQHADRAGFAIPAPGQEAADQWLSSSVARAIQQSGGTIKTISVQPASPGEARIRVECQVSLTQLVSGLKLAEGVAPFVIIDGLYVTAPGPAASGEPVPLDVRIEFSAPYADSTG